ncbi:Elongation_factor 2 [Hexamita inflata]|uniref:Elongation factor 2 n=1 Tax=Hexamita inflata TaxID=28002 RepID=A0AA86QML9_9EUKA|nr:Elongation factor 2 [Hexamita inflata]
MQEFIQKLQMMPNNVRNITIAAHIDHGKTTLSDSLLATNDMLNTSQQGKIRLLDFLPIEQQRFITVKSSSVSLVHLSTNFRVQSMFQKAKVPTLVQLFDSPGHCDFSQEVMTSLSICDGAVLLIDVVEGVRSQTYSIIQQLLALKLDIVLCLNKVDRLFDELKLTSLEIFYKILQTISDVNKIFQQIVKQDYFQLDKNVIIACGYAGWGFTLSGLVDQLKTMDALKDIENEELVSYLARSDCYLTTNGIKFGPNQSPLLVQTVLDGIHSIYAITQDLEKNKKKIMKTFLKMTQREMQWSFNTPSSCREHLLSQAFPLGKQVLDCVILNIKPPNTTQNSYVKKVEKFDCGDFVALCSKQLTDIDVEDFNHEVKNTERYMCLMRIVKQNQLNQMFLNKEFQCINGVKFKIMGLFQPLGKVFKRINYFNLTAGMIIGIETDVQLPNNCLIFQQQVQNTDNQVDELDALSFKASNKVDIVQIQPEQIQELKAKFIKIQEKVLQVQQPLINVTLVPDCIQHYTDFIEKVKHYAEKEMSVKFELSKAGDIQLIVCGDVHLDLCVEAINKIVDYDFRIGQIHMQVFETIIDGQSILKQQKSGTYEDIVVEHQYEVDQFLQLEQETLTIATLQQKLMNFPQLTKTPLQVNNKWIIYLLNIVIIVYDSHYYIIII